MHGDGCSPMPPSERGQWLLALGLFLLGVGMLVAVSTGVVGRERYTASAMPPMVLATGTPVPGAAAAASVLAGANGARTLPASEVRTGRDSRRRQDHRLAAIVTQPESVQQGIAGSRLVDQIETEIPTRWMEGFEPDQFRRRLI
jgi:hypothetical protein